jgi:hypothetical protein
VPVHVRHLQLVLEVGDGAQPAQHDLCALLARVLDEQSLEVVDLDARVLPDDVADHRDALLDGEERRLLRVVQHGHDDAVERAQAALEDADVSVRDRVERAGIDRDAHVRVARSSVTPVSP